MNRKTIVATRKTRKSAERLAVDFESMDFEPLNWMVIKVDDTYAVVRDWHPSDTGRSFPIMTVVEDAMTS